MVTAISDRIFELLNNPVVQGSREIVHILLGLGLILTILMTIDCALNRRDVHWFFVLWLLGPVGGIVYIIYFRELITFPFPTADLFKALSPTEARRCPRCGRSGITLVPFEEGRQGYMLCELCRAEMELRRDKKWDEKP
jgi:hypothetical protein